MKKAPLKKWASGWKMETGIKGINFQIQKDIKVYRCREVDSTPQNDQKDMNM
jgi:hypothetical protein